MIIKVLQVVLQKTVPHGKRKFIANPKTNFNLKATSVQQFDIAQRLNKDYTQNGLV